MLFQATRIRQLRLVGDAFLGFRLGSHKFWCVRCENLFGVAQIRTFDKLNAHPRKIRVLIGIRPSHHEAQKSFCNGVKFATEKADKDAKIIAALLCIKSHSTIARKVVNKLVPMLKEISKHYIKP